MFQSRPWVRLAVSLIALALVEAVGAQEPPEVRLPAITVKGEKVERSLEQTATSASVMTDERLQTLPGITTLDDVLSRTPNVVRSGTGNFAPTVRGNDATGPANGVFAFLAGGRPRLTIQQDGRPLGFNELVYGRTGLWDVERVEVLRGPQTTVQGRNSIAGAIVVQTKDPSFKPEAAGRAVLGNYDMHEVAGMVSGPLGDQVAYRVALDERRLDSWVGLSQDVGVSNPERDRILNARGKLLFAPDALPDFTAKLTFNHTDTRRPQTEYVDRPFKKRRFNGVDFPVFENKSNSTILDLDYAPSQSLRLRNSTTYADSEIARLTYAGGGNVGIDSNELTNELRAEFRSANLRGIVGTYYFDADADETIDIGPGAFKDRTRTVAFFGELTRTFLARWDLTLGARYEREKRSRAGGLGFGLDVDLDKTYDAFLPKVGIAFRPTDAHTVGVTVQRGWNAGGAGVDFATFTSFRYDEEYVWNYEAFFRSNLAGGRVKLNGNVFYADYKDQQRLAYLDPTDPSSGVIRNADSAESYGAELGAQWLATKNLELFGSLGLLKTKIKKFSASVIDLAGNEFARAPKVTATVGAIQRLPGGFSIGVDGQYVGSYYSDDDNLSAEKVDAYTLWNMQVAWERKNVRLFAFVTNIFDKDSKVLLFDANAQLVDPRKFGIGMQVRL